MKMTNSVKPRFIMHCWNDCRISAVAVRTRECPQQGHLTTAKRLEGGLEKIAVTGSSEKKTEILIFMPSLSVSASPKSRADEQRHETFERPTHRQTIGHRSSSHTGVVKPLINSIAGLGHQNHGEFSGWARSRACERLVVRVNSHAAKLSS